MTQGFGDPNINKKKKKDSRYLIFYQKESQAKNFMGKGKKTTKPSSKDARAQQQLLRKQTLKKNTMAHNGAAQNCHADWGTRFLNHPDSGTIKT